MMAVKPLHFYVGRLPLVLVALVIASVGVLEGPYLYDKFLTNLLALHASQSAPPSFLDERRKLDEVCPKPPANPGEPARLQCSTSDRCYLQGISALGSGDWDAAQVSLSRTQHPLSQYFAGWTAWCAGKPDRAIQEWSQYAAPLSQRFRHIGEDLLINTDTPQAALPWLALADDIQPGSAATLTLMGRAYAQEGSLERAADSYGMAIATGNASGDAYTGAAEVEYGLGRVEQAKQHIRTAIQLVPNGWLNWQIYGNMLLDENNPSEAATWYRRVISAKPDYAHAHATLSLALLRQGRMEDSLSPILEAMRLVRESEKQAEYLEAWIQTARGTRDPAEIFGFLEQTWAADPRNADALALLVRAEYVLGRCQEAADGHARLVALVQSQGVELPAIDRTCSSQN